MAKQINLGKPNPQDLARVTSNQPPKKVISPPQQKGRTLPSGTSLPLPSGKIVGAVLPSSLTPAERETLTSIGWTPDIPIPTHMAELLEKERKQRTNETEEVVLPVDPSTPLFQPPEPKDINKLSSQERERLLTKMKEAYDLEQQRAAEERLRTQASAKKIPGLEQALAQTEAAKKYSQRMEETIEDDRGTPPISNQPIKGVPAKESSILTDTGADVKQAFCPNCGHDMSLPDVLEPEHKDKMVFLHALLGQKTYLKDYELLGGNLIVTFRTLTTSELDVIYRQAWYDSETQKIVTNVDYWERINRYRLFLQLLSIRGTDINNFTHDLPDGLNKETNPNCEAEWNLGDTKLDPGETPLLLIEKWIVENVLVTETLFRIINAACNQFNRLVARLEAMADNSDFWKPTKEQS